MHCPSCAFKRKLLPSNLSEFLPCMKCPACGGSWLWIKDYIRWKEFHPESLEKSVEVVEEGRDTQKALICPVSGKIMLKYRICKSDSRKIDYSSSSCGVWLDQGEWEILVSRKLVYCLDKIVTQSWQKKLEQTEHQENIEQIQMKILGPDFKKVQELKAWLKDHPLKSEIIAQILSVD